MKRLLHFFIFVLFYQVVYAQDNKINGPYFLSGNLGYPLISCNSSIAPYTITSGIPLSYNAPTTEPPRYQIGAIPKQTLWFDDKGINPTVSFYILTDTLGKGPAALDYYTDPSVGKIQFDPTTRLFHFELTSKESGTFNINFIAVSAKGSISQNVEFFAERSLIPEYITPGVEPTAPPADEGDEYTIISQTCKEKYRINNLDRKAYSISISGKTLVFDDRQENRLRDLNRREDIYELNLYAEKIIIRSSLRFPQTNVTIYAREIVFDDSQETAGVSLNTTPMPLDILGDTNGANGENAGNISIYLQKLTAKQGLRLIANGAPGQSCTSRVGQSGKAGDGGNGGKVISNLNLQNYCDTHKGNYGTKYDLNSQIVGFGNQGNDGTFEQQRKLYTWVHPNILNSVVKYATDAYINVNNTLAKTIYENYSSILADFQKSDEWLTTSPDIQKELSYYLTVAQNELYKLNNNMDYFGNPFGWAPLLSFEVNKAIFEQEINSAIRVMYLNYWLTHIEATSEQKANVMKQSMENISKNISLDKKALDEFTQSIPVLENDITMLNGRIEDLTNELNVVTQVLMKKAKRNVKKKNRYSKMMGIISSAVRCVSMVVGADVGGALGSLISFAGQTSSGFISNNDYATAGNSFFDQAAQFNYKGLKDTINTYVQQMNENSLGNNLSTTKKYYEEINKMSQGLIGSITKLQETFSKSSAPKNQVEQELNKLKAESPVYNSLVQKVLDLETEKIDISFRLTSTLASISSIMCSIQNDLLAADHFGSEVFNINSQKDVKAMQYLDGMNRRSQERLLKYHYYLKKAYEYRLLANYKGDLNLSNMVNRFKTIAEKDTTQYMLSSSDFETLKVVFEEQLSTITAEILKQYNTSKPQYTLPISYRFTKEELEILNNQQPIVLNLLERGVLSPKYENVRISDVKITSFALKENSNKSFGYFDLDILHEGINIFSKNGQQWWFNTSTPGEDNPLSWGAHYDALSNTFTKKVISFSDQSLLYSLLEKLNSEKMIMEYSRPSAWGNLIVTKSDVVSPGQSIPLDSLSVEFMCDFTDKSRDMVYLHILTNHQLSPYIKLSMKDRSSRSDGRGNFLRAYSKNSKVTLETPETCGTYKFKCWEINNYSSVKKHTTPILEISLDYDYQITANYESQDMLLVPDSLVLPMTAGNTQIEIQGVENSDEIWERSGSSAKWLTYEGDSILEGDGSFTIRYLDNSKSVTRKSAIQIFNIENPENPRTIPIIQRGGIVSNEMLEEGTAIQVNVDKKAKLCYISLPIPYKDASLKLYSPNGKMEFSQGLTSNTQHTVPMPSHLNGVYILCIDSGNERVFKGKAIF